MNVELLEKVKAHILEEPRRLEMGEGVVSKPEIYFDGRRTVDELPPCGTAACIAGWACVIGDQKSVTAMKSYARGQKRWTSISNKAIKLLDLSESQAESLFYADEWPEQFADDFFGNTLTEKARLAAARISHFIKTKGAE